MLYVNGKFNIDGNASYGDKSISHRALILASIAHGKSTITNLSLCKDVQNTIDCLKTLGAQIQLNGTTAVVTPIETPNTNVNLYCGNSGTTARLIAGLVAGLKVEASFYGDESLSKRSMDDLAEVIKRLSPNMRFSYWQNSPGPKNSYFLFSIFRTGIHERFVYNKYISESASAQVKSAALLLMFSLVRGNSYPIFIYSEMIKTRDHTERLLNYMGVDVSSHPDNGNILFSPIGMALEHGFIKFEEGFIPQSIYLEKSLLQSSDLNGCQIDIPNDVSSASYLIALSLLTGQKTTLKNIGVNPTRIGLIEVLQNSGANIFFTNKQSVCNEDVADIVIEKSNLEPLYSTPQQTINAIDEIPLLAAIACFVEGESTFCRVQGLKNKESDRIETTIKLVESLGQTCTFDGKNLTVISNGKPKLNPFFKSFSDHRIAMTAVICSLALGGGTIDDDSSTSISFPSFYDVLGVKPYNFALFGSNISYTLSPILMNFLAEQSKLSCRYSVVDLPSDVSDEVLSQVNSYDGANVTTPFKNRVATLCNSNLPSVNTVGKNILPQSTDIFGLFQALQNHGFEYKNQPIWVIGAGGAAEACIDALVKQGAKIQVFNRTTEKVQFLTQKYNLSQSITNPRGILSFVPSCDYLATIPIPPSVKYVFSASYVGQNPLAVKADRQGIPFIDGLEMLFYQGAKSFSLWTNTEICTNFDGFLQYLKINFKSKYKFLGKNSFYSLQSKLANSFNH